MQRVRITADNDLDDDTTWRYKLPSLGKYTAFELVVDSQRGNTRTDIDAVHTLENCISKIELLAGGARALLSLTGTQIDAMNYWDLKRPNARRYRQADETGNKNLFFLMGGRDLYDERYGWDMAKLGETYLEYTYDLGENDTDYFEADQHNVKLYGYRWMGPGEPNFMGYLRSRQLAAWTTSASDALKTIAIPVGNPVRRIAVQAKTRGCSLGGAFDELEVRCNEGEYSPVIVKSMFDWILAEVAEYNLHNAVGGMDYAVSTFVNDLPYWWGAYGNVVLTSYQSGGALDYEVSGITLPARFLTPATGNREVSFVSHGYGFQKCLRIGFDHDPDGFDLLQTGQLGSLDLLVTEGAQDKAVAMFVQDIVSY